MKMKKVISIMLTVAILSLMGVVYAATAKTPAEIAANVTGKSVDEVTALRNEGKTYGQVANDSGKLDEFKTQMLEERKAILDQRVKEGRLTQEQADAIYNNMKNNQATCDGTGPAVGRKGCGMSGGGQGCGAYSGQGCGMGRGNGQRFGRG